MHFSRNIIILIILSGTSCTMIRKANEALDKANVALSDVNRITAGISVAATAMGESGKSIIAATAQAKQEFLKADLNNDGSVSGWREWKELVAGLGILIVGWFTKKGVDERITRSKRDLHSRIDKVSEKP